MHSDYSPGLGKVAPLDDVPLPDLPSATIVPAPRASVVQSLDKTRPATVGEFLSEEEYEKSVDALFGDAPSYTVLKREKPAHRLMLWHTLQGMKPVEIATAMRVVPGTVYKVQAQPWFKDAFGKLSREYGSTAVTNFLEGAVMPALMRVEKLATAADSDAVKLAANKEILDRFLGKATVKIESKNETRVENVVYDVEKLKAEKARLQEALKNHGAGGTN